MHPIQRAIEHLRRKLEARLESIVLRAVVHAVNDGAGFQVVKAEALGDVFDKLEHLQQGGVSHTPLSGAEGLLVCPLGRRNLAVVALASNRDARPKGHPPGTTFLYTVGGIAPGVKVYCDENGVVHAGSDAAEYFVARADKVDAAIATLKTAVSAGLTAVGVGGAANGTTGATAFNNAATTLPTAAELLKTDAAPVP